MQIYNGFGVFVFIERLVFPKIRKDSQQYDDKLIVDSGIFENIIIDRLLL
jgi:hypothetical protein